MFGGFCLEMSKCRNPTLRCTFPIVAARAQDHLPLPVGTTYLGSVSTTRTNVWYATMPYRPALFRARLALGAEVDSVGAKPRSMLSASIPPT